jgi:vacuolar-type H+-ATPase subunit C/Vma6
VGLFLSGDPLGLDVPVAYATAKENEVRNLRLLVEETRRPASAAEVRMRLMLPGSDDRWGR